MVAVCGADVMSLQPEMVAVWRRCDVFTDRDGGCVWRRCDIFTDRDGGCVWHRCVFTEMVAVCGADVIFFQQLWKWGDFANTQVSQWGQAGPSISQQTCL
jgi:hypothetical protein